MTDRPLVYFEGQWPDSERSLVERAAEAAEEKRGPKPGAWTDATWIALAHDGGGSSVYLASRRGSSEALRAPTAEELAEKIRQYGA